MNDHKIKEDLLSALQLDEAGDWDGARRIVQQYYSAGACWIHAYLHRKEGDLGNAGYWYSRANRAMPQMSLEKEWKTLFEFVTGL